MKRSGRCAKTGWFDDVRIKEDKKSPCAALTHGDFTVAFFCFFQESGRVYMHAEHQRGEFQFLQDADDGVGGAFAEVDGERTLQRLAGQIAEHANRRRLRVAEFGFLDDGIAHCRSEHGADRVDGDVVEKQL